MSNTAMMEFPGVTAPQGLPRLLGPGGADLPEHLRTHGPLPHQGALIEEIEAAGLTGRGGAGFPTAVKLAAVARQPGSKVAVGNGAESEPASHKDKQLLWLAPHLVLDGLQLAAAAVGARRACLYLHRHDQLRRRLTDALAERAAAGWDRVAVELVTAPPRFLAGEESALASRIGGGLARPRFKRPPVYERGAGGAPTLVQNVETLAHLALIARHGAPWFRQVGTAAEPGSVIVTAHRADGVTVVREVPAGLPLGGLLGRAPAQAVLVGGYHGTWIPVQQAARLPLANAALRPLGAAVGAGVLAALPPDRCGLAETARVLRYLAAESAGQCGPCLNGLPRIATAFAVLARPGADRRCLDDLERWAGLVTGRGACHHPDGTVRLVRSALAAFSAETGRHLRGRCAADPAAAPFLPVPGSGYAAPSARRDWR
ncbi:MAG TPA: NADH-ubiquinone oxidoreductase-F iron-sulfur binding region domain-containing protein [Streptosporangiaceae bacterium]|jgi:NADH:ubiquinone oxidoreductase subunit F (NADH-binding)